MAAKNKIPTGSKPVAKKARSKDPAAVNLPFFAPSLAYANITGIGLSRLNTAPKRILTKEAMPRTADVTAHPEASGTHEADGLDTVRPTYTYDEPKGSRAICRDRLMAKVNSR